MDRENKAVKIRSGSPQKTQQNLILSFLAPRTGALAKVMLDKLPWESDAE